MASKPFALVTQESVSLVDVDRALFASDLHLGEQDRATAEFVVQSLRQALLGSTIDPLRKAQFSHLFLLGDIFDYWIGDDDHTHPYAHTLADLLGMAQGGGTKIFLMHGNRDFLLGKAPGGQVGWLNRLGATLLSDPCILRAFGRRIVLTHGDLLCTDDPDYQNYRKLIRDETWQTDFLAKPLAERRGIAQAIRAQSDEGKSSKPLALMDATEDAVVKMATDADASLMVHGHTHRPAEHLHRAGEAILNRYVLPDWYAAQGADTSRRGYFLVLDAKGMQVMRPTPPSSPAPEY